jgi:regulator of replication initiation timing
MNLHLILCQQLGLTAKVAEEELTSVLDSMVHDNEVLKRDNAELQHLLAESREEIHNLQEQLEEQRVNPPFTNVPFWRCVKVTGSRHYSSIV